ncbi:peptidoglycan-associated lipoprotein [Edaphobacter lichenicola]|uniref:Peptidoglycan-associated lipoprotein n=1 Tax=Tunturiibacter gelidiferens TaxID=3069689 RepID=A0ACC5NVF5_9BACT|nr:peptidoglycan-associated lipoprotein [Edaphobacter lichenicola]
MNAMQIGIRKTLVIAVTLISIGAVTGCHKKASGIDPNALGPAPAPPAAAPTATITADPLSIDVGQSVVLNWRTQNAASVTIDGIGDVSTNGTQTVAPSTSTNFHLTAKGDGGTTEASVRVTVRVPAAPTAPPPADTDMGTEAAFHQNVQDVFFDYDSFDLRPDATSAASKAAAYLTAHPAIRVVIGGYCDDRGSAEYNLALGENRANAARTALVSAGVPASRLRVISYGKEKQFCTEENESCWQQNRRAQFSLDR